MGVLDSLKRALGPTYDAAREYRCSSCERSFAYSEKIRDPTCPYCDADDLVELR